MRQVLYLNTIHNYVCMYTVEEKCSQFVRRIPLFNINGPLLNEHVSKLWGLIFI